MLPEPEELVSAPANGAEVRPRSACLSQFEHILSDPLVQTDRDLHSYITARAFELARPCTGHLETDTHARANLLLVRLERILHEDPLAPVAAEELQGATIEAQLVNRLVRTSTVLSDIAMRLQNAHDTLRTAQQLNRTVLTRHCLSRLQEITRKGEGERQPRKVRLKEET